MRVFCRLASLLLVVSSIYAATFGTVVPVVGGISDLVLDEPRGRLYLVNANTDRVEVYSIAQRRFLTAIRVDSQPLAAAISKNGKVLYVTSYGGNLVDLVDLDSMLVTTRINLPARPEGIAVGADDRVLITTVGTGTGNTQNVLIVYDPFAPAGTQSLVSISVAPAAPANPLLPPNNLGRAPLTSRSFLQASQDGKFIVGVNIPNTTSRAVFVYEVASSTVLRSRTVTGVSSVLSVSPDGSKFMAGLNLFERDTLTVIAQQNAANAPYPLPTGSNFSLQQNQGGSVFSPDGSQIYSAFNFTPVTIPTARPNVSQLMINDPDNLLINMALQMPENIAGKMVISRDGGSLYALSESGFTIVPLSTMRDNPIAALDTTVALIANDQCGVSNAKSTVTLDVKNAGRGRLLANIALLQQTPTGAGALGGNGAGGGLPGLVIPIQPQGPGTVGFPVGIGNPFGQNPGGAALPAAGGARGGTNNNVFNSAPQGRVRATSDGVSIDLTYNTFNRGLGTVSPTHQYVVQSDQAINIPPAIKVFQNNRNAEYRGDIIPVEVGLSASEGLVDMVQDPSRQRLYIANSAMNRVEVFDTRAQRFLKPIKAGQLPRALAMTVDGQTLYIGNTGGESITIIDLDKMQQVGTVRFPAVPFASNAALVTPLVMAATQRGVLMLTNSGSLWRIVGKDAIPVRFNTAVIPVTNGAQTIAGPTRSIAAAPNGEVALVLAGNGFVYLYDALLDDFVQSRQVFTGTISGYYGPISVGPRGQYFLVNGIALNQSLSPISTAGTVGTAVPGGGGGLPGGGGFPGGPGTLPVAVAGAATQDRPIAAVAAIGLNSYARFAPPVIANANALATLQDTANVEIVDMQTGLATRSAPALERPLNTPTGNQRSNVPGRTMALDSTGTTAYILTTSGLSIVPLDVVPASQRPLPNNNGTVNFASLTTSIAQNGLISIFGRNLAKSATGAGSPLPAILGGTCVTINNRAIPLILSAPEQINAQVPPDLAPGRYQIVVRSIDNKIASTGQNVTVSKYAPAVMVDPNNKLPAVYSVETGKQVTKDNPASRDHSYTMLAVGLGPTKGAAVQTGVPSPKPGPITDKLQLFLGTPTINGAEMIIEGSALVPGTIGIYQITFRVPGNHIRGEKLPITIRIGNINSPVTGPVPATISVD